MKIYIKNSEVTFAQLKAELRAAEESLEEQTISLEENPKIPSRILIFEEQCRWFNIPFPFNDYFNLMGYIIIEDNYLKLCVNVSPVLVSMQLLQETDPPKIAEYILTKLKDKISIDKVKTFNARRTLAREFQLKLLFKNLMVTTSQNVQMIPMVCENDSIKFFPDTAPVLPAGVVAAPITPSLSQSTPRNSNDSQDPRQGPYPSILVRPPILHVNQPIGHGPRAQENDDRNQPTPTGRLRVRPVVVDLNAQSSGSPSSSSDSSPRRYRPGVRTQSSPTGRERSSVRSRSSSPLRPGSRGHHQPRRSSSPRRHLTTPSSSDMGNISAISGGRSRSQDNGVLSLSDMERLEHRDRTLREIRNNHNNVRNESMLQAEAMRNFQRAVNALCEDFGRMRNPPDLVRDQANIEPMDVTEDSRRTNSTICSPPQTFRYDSSQSSRTRSSQISESRNQSLQDQLQMQAIRIRHLEERNEELNQENEELSQQRMSSLSSSKVGDKTPKNNTTFSSSVTLTSPSGNFRITTAPTAAAFPAANKTTSNSTSSTVTAAAASSKQTAPTSSTARDLTYIGASNFNESTIMPPVLPNEPPTLSESLMEGIQGLKAHDTMISEQQRWITAREPNLDMESSQSEISSDGGARNVEPEKEKGESRRTRGKTPSLTGSEVNRIVDATWRGVSNPFSLSEAGSEAEVYIEQEIAVSDFEDNLREAVESLRMGGQETLQSLAQIRLWMRNLDLQRSSSHERRRYLDTMAILLAYITPIIKDNNYQVEARTEAVKLGRNIFTVWRDVEKNENRIYTSDRVGRNQQRMENLRDTGIAGDDTIDDMIDHDRRNMNRADTAPEDPHNNPSNSNPFE